MKVLENGNQRPNFVAEISANHNNSIERAHEIIDALAMSGATSIKLQTYKPETMTLKINRREYLVDESNALWGGRHLFDLYADAMTPWEWHAELFSHAADKGLIPFSSPFDASAVDFLETLACPIYKIASFEIVDVELIAYAASTGKPLIISTGMASLLEIARGVEAAERAGARDITLLKTTSSYPANPVHSNLATMSAMRDSFGWPVGLSDHTLGIGVAVAAATLGAAVIEKHVTLRRADGGIDSAFSLEPQEFESMVTESNRAIDAIGSVTFGPSEGDRDSLAFRRSYVLTKDVIAGERLSRTNSMALRPGIGLPIAYFELLEGLAFTRDFSRGDPVTPDMFR